MLRSVLLLRGAARPAFPAGPPAVVAGIGLGVILWLLWAGPVGAGGWATVTLDHLPADLRAGQTYRIGFTVLQHGMTPYV